MRRRRPRRDDSQYVAVKVKNHPARMTVYNLHRPDCSWAKSGDPAVTTLSDYMIGEEITRSTVPPETGWEFGKGSAGGRQVRLFGSPPTA